MNFEYLKKKVIKKASIGGIIIIILKLRINRKVIEFFTNAIRNSIQ
jgi:hypothetical protein